MLERYHTAFRRAGAHLDAGSKKRLQQITERLAALGTTFSQNVLADEQDYALMLEREDDLAGLPESVRAAARNAADERGQQGKHAITLSRSSAEPFLQFAAKRELREKIFRAFVARGDNGGKTDNNAHHRRNGRSARRARQAARLCKFRALPARRCHGQDAASRARAAR